MSLEWAGQVHVVASGGSLEVRREGDERRRRLVIMSSAGAKNASVLDVPERMGPALRDILNAMYPPTAPRL